MPHPVPEPRVLRSRQSAVFALALCALVSAALGISPAASPPLPAPFAPESRSDANGNPVRRATTGHVSNYDETKVGDYILPDPLLGSEGEVIDSPAGWRNQRRAELLEIYRREIYGRVPRDPPTVTASLSAREPILGNTGDHQVATLTFGGSQSQATVHVHIYSPAGALHQSPLLLHLLFGEPPGADKLRDGEGTPPALGARPAESGPIRKLLAQGYIYAAFRYTEIEPDTGKAGVPGVRGPLDLGHPLHADPDAWGSVAAWAWGASRVLDFLLTQPEVDGRRVALIGHSRLGKAVLWAGAQDERFSLIYSSCAGEMGSALARRDYGESLDDMAGNFGWQFAASFQKYRGRISTLPVDTHELIALQAPRPVFITGGTKDQWADPRGEFLAEVAASPVYRLLGRAGIGATAFPAADSPVLGGDLAYLYHTGPHAIIPGDWDVFLQFAGRYFHPEVHP